MNAIPRCRREILFFVRWHMPYLLQVFLLVIAGGVSPTLIALSILWVLMVGKAAIPELVRDLY